MTQHKYLSTIKAKAHKMYLEVLVKAPVEGDWGVAIAQDTIHFEPNYEYFLCHPKHRKECLHWLNGGNVQYKNGIDWQDVTSEGYKWSPYGAWTNPLSEFRIKPEKVQKWLVVYNRNLTVSPALLSEPIEATDEYQVIPVMVEVSNDN